MDPSCPPDLVLDSCPDSMASAAFDQAAGGRVRYDPRHMANRWVALAIVFVTPSSWPRRSSVSRPSGWSSGWRRAPADGSAGHVDNPAVSFVVMGILREEPTCFA